jgi:uncharacterized protein YidB (DUF937 family)
MGFLDSIESLASQEIQSKLGDSEQGRIAGSLMQAIQEHPGGVQGVLESMKQNGLDQHVQGWANGETPAATPDQVQQGLSGTNLIESVAEKAGVSPQVAQMAITTLLPIVVAHFAPNGQVAPQSEFGGLASQLLTRLL